MVESNKKFGNLQIPVITLGFGDVAVSVIAHKAEKYVGISFQNSDPIPIGEEGSDDQIGKTTDEVPMDAVIIFHDPRSIDVVIERLEMAKLEFKNIINPNH
jgi:hypothetical protein